ncbi:putative addiction module antidote protein [Salinivibrio sp. IB574]|uniref:addiction module antidote protein n=1 Tax=Salinivibrio sp. IB574 TaxID=1909444 RepID=UPI000988D2A4|nr:addiction module antidote protein [Salinivibrio sp. IB574]OOF21673.1 putative addiction module antidote protein [Salinivibrio sp. IB574]
MLTTPNAKLLTFDPAELLDNQEALQVYLDEAVQTGDPVFIADALGVIASAKGMADITKQTGLSRETFYRTLSQKGNPNLKTLIAIVNALGL